MTTLRVKQNDVYVGTYTIKDVKNTAVDLTAATPGGVELDIVNVDTGITLSTITCTPATPYTSGLVSYIIDTDVTSNLGMYLMVFKVDKKTSLMSYPQGSEQGLWVY